MRWPQSDSEQQIQHLNVCLAQLEQEKGTLKAQLALAQTQGQNCSQEKELLHQDLKQIQEREKVLAAEQEEFQKNLLDWQHRNSLLEQEKNTLTSLRPNYSSFMNSIAVKIFISKRISRSVKRNWQLRRGVKKQSKRAKKG